MSFLFPFCPLLCGQRTNIILEHIKNCKNKNLLGTKYFQCPYNQSHIFGKKVFQMHVDRCPDRFKKNNAKEENKEIEKKEEKDEKEEENVKEKEEEEENEVKKKEEEVEYEKEIEDEKEGNILIEDEEEENDNNLNQPKRHNTSINLDRYHNNSTLKELLFKPESRNSIRKKSENIPNKYKEKLKEEEEKLNNELIKIHENINEIKELNQNSQKNSSKNLNFKGILKKENNEKEYVRKHNSSHKVTLFLNSNRNKSESISFDDDSEDNNNEEEVQITKTKFKRGIKRSVSFKHFVKVFVFDEKKNKHIPKRSAFAKSSLKKQPETESEDISAVYMKSL